MYDGVLRLRRLLQCSHASQQIVDALTDFLGAVLYGNSEIAQRLVDSACDPARGALDYRLRKE
jgi:hypothetical protein